MRIVVNGEARDVPEGSTLADLLARLGLADKPCATEVNRSLVPRRQQGDRPLAEGDSVEVVTLVGGG